MSALCFHAGPKALTHLRQHGLRAQDIAIIPAAAGGPKGLILQALDQWLFGCWLPSAPRERSLIGASIGAWRMAAACHPEPEAAFQHLGELYCEQRYPYQPSSQFVSDACKKLLHDLIGGQEIAVTTHPCYRLHILTALGRGLLQAPQHKLGAMTGFAAATLANLASRAHLGKHLARVVIGDKRDPAFWLKAKFDEFETHFVPLSAANLMPALLASGTLPLLMQAVRELPQAPVGTYWDGGLIDYDLAFPYSRLAGHPDGGLVLYPHFTGHIAQGWLDKPLTWRRAESGKNRDWFGNVLLVSPSPAFLQTLSRGKLPDRQDYRYYGQDHDFRIRNWKLAIGEGERLRDAFIAFVEKPDLSIVQAI